MGAIEQYIKRKIDQGYSSEVIRRELMNSYSRAEVNNAFASLKGAPNYTWAWYVVGIVAVIFVAAIIIKITPDADYSAAEKDEWEDGVGESVAAESGGSGDAIASTRVEGLNCDEYCGKHIDACGIDETYSQYVDERTCLLQCEDLILEAGTLEDYSDNTVGCRIVHSDNAKRSNPEIHCYHAGMFGGNICGTWCDNYCSLSTSICTGDDAIYASNEECLGACRLIDKNTQLGDASGDTVQCRMKQLMSAIDDSTLCGDASPESEVCVAVAEPNCDEYCSRVVDVCGSTGALAQYSSERECLDFCSVQNIPVGKRGETTGNSIGCRLYHLDVAESVDRTVHCPHTGKTGADVCSSGIVLEGLSTAPAEVVELLTIRIVNFSFIPSQIEITSGTEVTWVNEDSAPHRVFDRIGYVRSPTLFENDTFTMTFIEKGTHIINCAIHPSMEHSITVV